MLIRIRGIVFERNSLKAILVLLTCVAMLAIHTDPISPNDMSRMATIQSLVESHSLIIDDTAFIKTIDKIYVNGHFYSEKPPMTSVVGAAIYLPLHALGFQLHAGSSLAYYLITLATVKMLWLFATIAFYYALGFTKLDAPKRLIATFALGFGSLFFSWSSVFNNHEFAGACLCIGFCFLLRARFGQARNWSLAAAAFFLSFAGSVDAPTVIFYAAFLLYVLAEPGLRRSVAFYLVPLLVTVLPTLALNYAVHRSILPAQNVKSYFEYPGSRWIESSGLSGVHINDVGFALRYAVHMSIGSRGFLAYNPMLWIALWGLFVTIRDKGTFYLEGIAVAIGCGILVLYYLLYTTDYSGWSYSIRWFVPMLPLLFFFLHPMLEAYNPKRALIFRTLLCVSVIFALIGAINPWSQGDLSEFPFLAKHQVAVSKLEPADSLSP